MKEHDEGDEKEGNRKIEKQETCTELKGTNVKTGFHL